MAEAPPLSIFWAKLGNPDPNGPVAYHPLICHLLDVAAVTERIWDEVLSPYARKHLADGLGIEDVEAARRWAAFLAGAHDIGKASCAFARRESAAQLCALYGGILGALPPSPRTFVPSDAPHGDVTAAVLADVLRERFRIAADTAKRLARVVGGHHGFFPSEAACDNLKADNYKNDAPKYVFPVGNGDWQRARARTLDDLASAIELAPAAAPSQLTDAAIMTLGEITTVADWIASKEEFFTYYFGPEGVPVEDTPSPIDAATYLVRARSSARRALETLGWECSSLRRQPRTFAELFPNIQEVRDVQHQVEEVADALADSLPALLIVEAPMGEGKTEAALFAADRWGADAGPEGVYVAMPTMATSNQMFSRIRKFMEERYKGKRITMNLLHGHASLSSELQAMLAGWNPDDLIPTQIWGEGEHDRDDTRARIIAGEWFTASKRALLPPIGVGTIDQALLGVIMTKHNFVRLGALAGKTVIFDEVHAYDAYMSTILEGLLSWLAALGSPVVLLSATLPLARRDALLRAYAAGFGHSSAVEVPAVDYPRLSWVSRDDAGAITVNASKQMRRHVALKAVDCALPNNGQREFPLGDALDEALSEGGCAAVICNTVKQARKVYRALEFYFPGAADDGRPELQMFHGRYRFLDRDRREKDTLVRFGKPDAEVEIIDGVSMVVRRPNRAVLVATQVIEQSLDLDFDLMVSQVAPVDLLLQRSGRLHRHNRARPARLAKPELWICRPDAVADGVPKFDRGTKFIYDEHVLLRSWLSLQGRTSFDVPEQIQELIDLAYGDAPWPHPLGVGQQRDWERSLKERLRVTAEYESKAKDACIWPPGNGKRSTLNQISKRLVEDRTDLSPAVQARTRLGEPSITLIILTLEEAACDGQFASPNGKPPTERLQFLLKRSVEITSRQVWEKADRFSKVPRAGRSPMLRGSRYVVLDKDGTFTPPRR